MGGYAFKYGWNINKYVIYVSGTTILNNANTCASSLYISGTTIFNNTITCSSTLTVTSVSNQLSLINNIWHKSTDGILRFYYENGGSSIFHSGNTGSEG
jgi:hypothetical protein